MTQFASEVEGLNKIIADQKREMEGLRAELREEREKNRRAFAALNGAQSIDLPTMQLEEFAPASSQPKGTRKNPLADSFVL